MRPRKRIDFSLQELRSEPVPVRELASVRDRVLAEITNQPFRRGPSAFAMRFFSSTLALALLVGGTATYAQAAMPGDALYGVKRATENAWLAVQIAPDSRMRTQRMLLERRYKEVSALSKSDHAKEVNSEYAKTVRSITKDINAFAEESDPEITAARARRVSDILERQADALDWGNTTTNAYIEGMLRANDAVIEAVDHNFETYLVR